MTCFLFTIPLEKLSCEFRSAYVSVYVIWTALVWMFHAGQLKSRSSGSTGSHNWQFDNSYHKSSYLKCTGLVRQTELKVYCCFRDHITYNFGAVSLNSNKCFLLYSLSCQVFLMTKSANKYDMFIPIPSEKRLIGLLDPCHTFCILWARRAR